jgi:putative restriction endonuclease
MKTQYSLYINQTNISGSGKATSYIRALDLLSEMLIVRSFGFDDCIDVWNVTSLQRIEQLKELVTLEQRKQNDSEWLSGGIAPSYLIKGYCKAALSNYAKFLAESNQEDSLFNTFSAHKGDGAELSGLLDTEPGNIDILLDGLKQTEGEDAIRSVKTRLNQNVFRRMLMDIYNQSCCITGLNIPQVNRASHIISWADDASKRLDPSNGLYLSATYDAAFDKNLISLDDDYRIILANDIKDHFTRASVNEYFVKKEGQVINLPYKYLPNKEYLAHHRSKSDL